MNRYLTVKELPESERPYEKCERFGPEALSDAELLAVIIRSGTKKERAVDLPIRVLNRPGAKKGLSALHYYSRQELQKIRGIGKVKAIQLCCVAELAKRMQVLQIPSVHHFRSSRLHLMQNLFLLFSSC